MKPLCVVTLLAALFAIEPAFSNHYESPSLYVDCMGRREEAFDQRRGQSILTRLNFSVQINRYEIPNGEKYQITYWDQVYGIKKSDRYIFKVITLESLYSDYKKLRMSEQTDLDFSSLANAEKIVVATLPNNPPDATSFVILRGKNDSNLGVFITDRYSIPLFCRPLK